MGRIGLSCSAFLLMFSTEVGCPKVQPHWTCAGLKLQELVDQSKRRR